MTERQLMVVKLLMKYDLSDAATHGYVDVLVDAPPEDVAFMENLIQHGYVAAHRTRSERFRLPCFAFAGFTKEGHKIYDPLVDKREGNNHEQETTEA